jgi:hypothetical protein
MAGVANWRERKVSEAKGSECIVMNVMGYKGRLSNLGVGEGIVDEKRARESRMREQ